MEKVAYDLRKGMTGAMAFITLAAVSCDTKTGVDTWESVDSGTETGENPPAVEAVALSSADALFDGESGQHAGWSLAGGDVDGDGIDEVIIGAPEMAPYGSGVGTVFVVHGPVTGSVALSGVPTRVSGSMPNGYAGWSVATGDVTGDGVGDLLVGARYADEGGEESGTVYIVSGPVMGSMDLAATEGALLGASEGDSAGTSLALGDLNGDNVQDVLVGSPASGAWLVLGPLSGVASLGLADATFIPEADGDLAGYALASGDFDGDGFDDSLIGSPAQHSSAYGAGAAYVFTGPVSGSVDLASADTKYVGEAIEDRAGMAVAAGDLDDDGLDDYLIGAPGEHSGGTMAGAVYFVLDSSAGIVDLSLADGKLIGEVAGDYAGVSVAAADVDGNDVDDIIVGVQDADEAAADQHAAYVVKMPVTGAVNLSEADVRFDGDRYKHYTSYQVSSGDIDGNGISDVLIGSAGLSSENTGGTTYLFYSDGI